MSRKFVLSVALTALLLLITSVAMAQDEVVTLTFWGDWSGEGESQISTMVEAFNSTHDNIQVQYVVTQDMVTSFLTAATSGGAPDIMIWDRWRTSLYAPRGVFLPINDYMAADGITSDQFFTEAIRELSWDDNVYGLPLTVDARALFYNVDMLEAAGVEPPTTWEELKEAAIALTQRDENGVLQVSGWALSDAGLFNMYLQQAGGQMVTDDGSATSFNNEQGLSVLNFWQELLDAGVYEVGFEQGLGESVDPFVTGRIAMIYNGPWMLSTYETYGDELTFGVVPPPAGPNGDTGSVMGGFGLVIPAAAQHPDEAWEFMKWWLAQPENALLWAQTSRNIPGNLEALEDPYFQDDPYLPAFIETLQVARIRPPFAGYSPMEVDALIPAAQLFLQGGISAEDALAQAQQQGDIILVENNEVS